MVSGFVNMVGREVKNEVKAQAYEQIAIMIESLAEEFTKLTAEKFSKSLNTVQAVKKHAEYSSKVIDKFLEVTNVLSKVVSKVSGKDNEIKPFLDNIEEINDKFKELQKADIMEVAKKNEAIALLATKLQATADSIKDFCKKSKDRQNRELALEIGFALMPQIGIAVSGITLGIKWLHDVTVGSYLVDPHEDVIRRFLNKKLLDDRTLGKDFNSEILSTTAAALEVDKIELLKLGLNQQQMEAACKLSPQEKGQMKLIINHINKVPIDEYEVELAFKTLAREAKRGAKDLFWREPKRFGSDVKKMYKKHIIPAFKEAKQDIKEAFSKDKSLSDRCKLIISAFKKIGKGFKNFGKELKSLHPKYTTGISAVTLIGIGIAGTVCTNFVGQAAAILYGSSKAVQVVCSKLHKTLDTAEGIYKTGKDIIQVTEAVAGEAKKIFNKNKSAKGNITVLDKDLEDSLKLPELNLTAEPIATSHVEKYLSNKERSLEPPAKRRRIGAQGVVNSGSHVDRLHSKEIDARSFTKS